MLTIVSFHIADRLGITKLGNASSVYVLVGFVQAGATWVAAYRGIPSGGLAFGAAFFFTFAFYPLKRTLLMWVLLPLVFVGSLGLTWAWDNYWTS